MIIAMLAILAVLLMGIASFLNHREKTHKLMLWEQNQFLSRREINANPIEVADTVWDRLEKQWEQEHPTEAQLLRKDLAARDKLISEKSALIAELKKKPYDRGGIPVIPGSPDWTMEYDGTFTIMGNPAIMLRENRTEDQIAEILKQAAMKMAKTARIPGGGILTIPQMKIAAPVHITVEEYNSGSMYDRYRDNQIVDSLIGSEY